MDETVQISFILFYNNGRTKYCTSESRKITGFNRSQTM